MSREFIDGNTAVAYGVKLSRTEVIAAYPITPQTKIVEQIADFVAKGEMHAEYVKVESEHSALSACLGASAVGARTFTATSSQGLAYMFEMLHYVSGGRFPVVMAVSNRAVGPPWNIWCDHQDSVSVRDTGWVQLYVETSQEALDACIMAFKIAEETALPVMVCLDGFTLSHTNELVDVPDQAGVDAFLPQYRPQNLLDAGHPRTLCAGAMPDLYQEFRLQQQDAMENAKGTILRVCGEFKEYFRRDHGGLTEEYRCEDADAVLVLMGAVASTAKDVVDALRKAGSKAGVLRIRSLRPFPREDIQALTSRVRAVGVLDRDISFGYEGALFSEVKAALLDVREAPPVKGYVTGLGGRDIRPEDIERMFEELFEMAKTPRAERV